MQNIVMLILRRWDFKNVTCSQYVQHVKSSVSAYILLQKAEQSRTVIREKLRKALSYKKVARKMLMKLAPGKNAGIIAPRWLVEGEAAGEDKSETSSRLSPNLTGVDG